MVISKLKMNCEATFLDRMRLSGDEKADRIIRDVFSSNNGAALYPYFSLTSDQLDRFVELPNVNSFLREKRADPSWFKEERLQRGQQFFRKFALDIMTLLGALSLPYCYAASPGNKAIHLTQKMRKSPGKRLLETAHFIITVMQENGFCNGSATFEIQKTRLIHALVRYMIQTKGSWDESWGVPVNQEDMAGTNLAFSFIVLRGLETSRYRIDHADREDFLHTWRYIGYQLHIDESLLPATYDEAADLENAIKARHFRHSTEGTLLTRELIEHYKESFPAVAGFFVDSQIRYLVGAEIADLLGIDQSKFKDAFVIALNRIREKFNSWFVNPYSYEIMIRNHYKLKQKYSPT